MKQILTLSLIVVLFGSLIANNQQNSDDSDIQAQLEKLEKLEAQNQELIRQLDERIESLEDARKTLNIWIGAFAVFSVYTIYLAFWGIKSIAEKEAEKKVQYQFEKLAPGVVAKELENHPVIREYNRIEKIKQLPIAVLGYEKKDGYLDTFLTNKGFKPVFFKIDDFASIDPNTYKLLLFNNSDGNLLQKKMNEVCNEHKSAFNYFYFKGKGENWDNNDVKMAGFATTLERLENNLVDALAKYAGP